MNQPYILLKPIMTEKTLAAQKLNCFSFEVDVKATKNQIKAAVERFHKVNVTKVRTITIKSVSKRTGRKRLPGKTTAFKKAMVSIKAGQSIGAFEVKN
jgi:large subunit ribosomal protein L23